MSYWFAIFIIVFSLLISVFGFIYIYRKIWLIDSRIRRITQNLWLVIYAVGISLLLLEITFKVFFIQSDGIDYTLASQQWFDKYWQPINSLGYRDYEWTSTQTNGRIPIAVIGDSFVAGHGIKKIDNRFSNKLGEILSESYFVMTIAQNGWGPEDELAALKSYPIKPAIVIYSYYMNDIEPAGNKAQRMRPSYSFEKPSGLSGWLIDHSYFSNFLYWRWFRWHEFSSSAYTRTEVQSYQDYMYKLYQDPEVWAIHKDELQRIIDAAQQMNAQLVVVIFPDMLDLQRTHQIEEKVKQFFQKVDIPVVDVAGLIEDYPPQKLIVNPVDSHPSEMVHGLVAKSLAEIIDKLQSR